MWIWNIAAGQVEQTPESHSDWVRRAVFSPDRGKLFSGSVGRTVRVWNVTTGHVEQTLEGHSGSVSSTFSLDEGTPHSLYSIDVSSCLVPQDDSRFLYLPLDGRSGYITTKDNTLGINTLVP
jgi:WD40 repeat protein